MIGQFVKNTRQLHSISVVYTQWYPHSHAARWGRALHYRAFSRKRAIWYRPTHPGTVLFTQSCCSLSASSDPRPPRPPPIPSSPRPRTLLSSPLHSGERVSLPLSYDHTGSTPLSSTPFPPENFYLSSSSTAQPPPLFLFKPRVATWGPVCTHTSESVDAFVQELCMRTTVLDTHCVVVLEVSTKRYTNPLFLEFRSFPRHSTYPRISGLVRALCAWCFCQGLLNLRTMRTVDCGSNSWTAPFPQICQHTYTRRQAHTNTHTHECSPRSTHTVRRGLHHITRFQKERFFEKKSPIL